VLFTYNFASPVRRNDLRVNRILEGLPPAELDDVVKGATPISLAAGQTLLRTGEPYLAVTFPISGIISAIGTLKDGQQHEVTAIGPEGLVGLGTILGVPIARTWFVAPVPTTAYQLPIHVFVRMFDTSTVLRTHTLIHAGRLLASIARSASCNRFHSHRERLARWLFVTMKKSGQTSLTLTHDIVAQMVGGPRHTVSAELAELRAIGAIDYHRGEITILDEGKVRAAACDCLPQDLV